MIHKRETDGREGRAGVWAQAGVVTLENGILKLIAIKGDCQPGAQGGRMIRSLHPAYNPTFLLKTPYTGARNPDRDLRAPSSWRFFLLFLFMTNKTPPTNGLGRDIVGLS